MINGYTFALRTLGCKVNQYEGDELASGLIAIGLERVAFDLPADVYVVNGCTVTGTANHKARQLIRRAGKLNPAALIVVTGCYADGAGEEIKRLLNGTGMIVGNALKAELAKMIADALGVTPGLYRDEGGVDLTGHARPLVKVQDGCDSFCAYCIVPYVRGCLSSKPFDDVLAEVSILADGGAEEVVLTGIHLGHYGADLKPRKRLDHLLTNLAVARGPRIRLSSIEVREITPRIIELAARSGRLCRHFHIPLQSGSDPILKSMNRHYTGEEFLEMCGRIRKAIPGVAITTDVMVGFPGETEVDFEKTLDLIEKVSFSKVHAFRFSPRPGTPAAEMPGQLAAHVKEERLHRLMSLEQRLASGYASSFVGKELEVIAENQEPGAWVGMSDNYLRVRFNGPDGLAGKLVEVEAVESRGNTLYGRLKE
ncbi:MAG: tRNA (N(6)-L-threonylcarbamoyladenosine(37)-C(2))-methylthiotransferase MtaB [Actinobacteria bacterium]|nr:tRNA (N(6)-L-threonylcarbamoyladenosine(37)-C(2))-methylthiotransferase MtaB [Actinomycetota bacterium]